MSDDWRLDNLPKELNGATLERRRYEARSQTLDHDHCAACMAKFAEFEGPDIQHEGYTTRADYPRGAGYEWICMACFSDLKHATGWTEAPS
jgi:hypothetical protein